MEKRGLTDALQEAGLTADDDIVWADEMRIGLIGQVRRVWVPRGFEIVQEKEFVYEWAYLNLAVDIRQGQLQWDWTENVKAVSIAPVVEGWSEHGLDAIVWDGAPGHHGSTFDAVQTVRIQQPAYSPELNPVERVFQELRARIEGKVYGSLAAKKTTVETELENLAADPERVRRLVGWNWIASSIERLPSV